MEESSQHIHIDLRNQTKVDLLSVMPPPEPSFSFSILCSLPLLSLFLKFIMSNLHDVQRIQAKFSSTLSTHIGNVNWSALTRIPLNRFVNRAVQHIGQIELVSASDFTTYYDELYKATFEIQAERERSDLIVTRLEAEAAGQRKHLAPYRIIGIRDHDGHAIGACQFSVLFLPDSNHAVPYTQYTYVRKQNRRQDMAGIMHMMVMAVTTADANRNNRVVLFILLETEPAGHGKDKESRDWATKRTAIHTKGGAMALMLRNSEGKLRSPHVQPGLEIGDPPLSLVWAIRDIATDTLQIDRLGQKLIAGYYQSLRDEGFPEENIKLAEDIVAQRSKGCEFILTDLNTVVLPQEDFLS